jgi:Tol biopolymer transport system component
VAYREWDIYKINVKNLRKTRLTHTPGAENWPSWSPDGRKIAFTTENGAIYVMNHDGSNPTPVFRFFLGELDADAASTASRRRMDIVAD